MVRRFGRDQTREQRAGEAELESTLEYDALELAVVAGADLAGGTVSPAVYEFAGDLAGRLESCPLPGVEALDGVGEELARVVQTADGGEESPSTLDI
ncbi:MAG: hypothetical protein U5K37_11660 [Natrialbaceae archaeon]|nr:hypothetical protein [Natrialbaceae archaeon]